ncbi:vesicle coat protein [Exophiala viscosa]|uniref:vesicle coat protein n=1 Tax=Exophiala viscosa TaxID=2486360 RepID=UPI0021A1211A|nr:vesicle coat protein [Exophiala viscosa]
MDFTLALTHFCEAHGPKSVLCTQVLPIECAQCLPSSPSLRACSSSQSFATQVNESSPETNHNSHTPPLLRKTVTNLTLPTDFSGASTTVDSETEPDSPTIEKHPLYKAIDQKREIGQQWRYGRAQGDNTCASCSFSVPKRVAEKLPAGAPGSKKPDGQNNTRAPVLRSREFVCLREGRASTDEHESKPSSYGASFASSQSQAYSAPRSFAHSSDGCHDHNVTYLTTKSPDNPESYAHLRASVIRTLSCELLPRGMSDGPFCFGDSDAGYTIAYVFRLTDPKARGRRRAYAFVALAGNDASRAFQALPMLWEAFASMAKGIEAAAQRHQDEERRKQDEEADAKDSSTTSRNYTPVSSFLTARANDPDGHPRRVGQATPRSLEEIVGDENIFVYLHQYFVAILRCLGEQFGGQPLVEDASSYQSIDEQSSHFRKASQSRGRQSLQVDNMERLRDVDATPKPEPEPPTTSQDRVRHLTTSTPPNASGESDDLDVAKTRANKAFKLNPQCAPLPVSETAQRQVVV